MVQLLNFGRNASNWI